MKENYVRKAYVIRVIDGDTAEVILDLGYCVAIQATIRFLGIDTPERGQDGYYEAKEFVADLIEDKDVYIQTEKFKTGGFNRYLGTIFVDDGETVFNLNDLLVSKNLAKVYER